MINAQRAKKLVEKALEYDKKRKFTRSFLLYLEAAKLGNALAQNNTAYAYLYGEGTEKNYKEAVYWLEKAAAQNHASAINMLGYCYSKGYGVAQDKHRALEYYEKAAAMGDKLARENIEILKVSIKNDTPPKSAEDMVKEALEYDKKKEFARSFQLYLEAAKMGNALAQNNTAYAYLFGEGVGKDYKEAVYWLEKAAAQNHTMAINNLGYCYSNGYGVTRDKCRALEYYEKAAALGSRLALQNIEKIKKEILKKQENDTNVTVSDTKYASAIDELDALIGLDTVKQNVKEMFLLTKYRKKREEANKKTFPISMHMVFTGNPGTGKTTVARMIARIYHEMGLLEKAEIVEVSRSDLVAEYIGQTAVKTKKKIDEAMGGVLFIDEAYTLAKPNSEKDFGQEAIDTLLKEMEDNRDKLMVIVAGYTEEMHRFINSNPGLKSRFKKVLHFDDYNATQLFEIFCAMAKEDEYRIQDDAKDALLRYFQKVYRNRDGRFGNGREVRNFYQDVIIKHAARVSRQMDLNNDDITKEDIETACSQKQSSQKDTLAELNEMIGLENMKKEVNQLIHLAKYQKLCQENNLQAPPVSMHMVFTGNPGTGKTTVARLIGQIYHEIGLLSKPDCVEADRSMLVAQHVGQTAVKTKNVIDRAMGGVLFIDEAYTLSGGSSNDFGQEAIDTLLKEMEDHRESLVVIVAGYRKEMKEFIGSNPGLQSRFTKTIHFDDYSAVELEKIFLKLAKAYMISAEARTQLNRVCEKMISSKSEHFGNGREVRNFFESVISKLAMRVSGECNCSSDALNLIVEEDILEAEKDFFKDTPDTNNRIGFIS